LRWFAAKAGSIMLMFLQFVLIVIISAILYAKGEAAASGVRRFAQRLAGRHGEDSVNLSAKAIRGVALGIVVTAVIRRPSAASASSSPVSPPLGCLRR
jgi:predicted PurR-regulated permease PerM